MKLEQPFLQLPLSFDAQVLAQEIEALGESAWRPHPQGFAGNSALPLVSVGGDPASDAVRGAMRPTPQLLACPYLLQTMHSLGAVWGRSRLMRLSGQAEVTPHVDINYYWREHVRVHVPIVTQPTVSFHCGDAKLNMAAGECWIFDTWRLHRVLNDDHRSRIHLVADTVGGHGFWQLMRQSRPHDRQVPGWQPRLVAPGAPPAALDYESFNLPLVMSPWEVREHLAFLMSETQPHESLRALAQGVIGPFVRDWHALWAKYGDSGQGLDEFRQLRDGVRAQLPRFEHLRLLNGIPLVKALGAIVTGNLVASQSAGDIEVRDQPQKAGGMTATPTTAPAVAPASAPSRSSAAAPPSAGPGATSAAPAAPAAQVVAVSAVAPHTPVAAAAAAAATRFDRPVIILSAPRSGSTLLFETLAKAPGLYTIGGESHRAIESLPGLHPAARGFDSNRLLGEDASAEIIAAMRRNFDEALRDRDGKPAAPGGSVRLLEKTPKNTLRLPFLRKVFPDARFIYLYRDPQQAVASMIEAWQSGRFRTYPDLPGWTGLPWSLLLVPGWRELAGLPLEELAARQWAVTTATLLDDLETLPPAQIVGVRYESFLAKPQAEIERLCARTGLPWDVALDDLPLSRHTLTPPDPDKWRKHEAALARVWPLLAATRARAERFFAG